MMNPQIKQQWLDALRSGEYKQGEGFLRKRNQFCCLGVLCDIVDPEKWERSFQGNGVYEIEGDTQLLPFNIRKATDLTNEIPGNVHLLGTLMGMNDDGKSFAEIADYIEANL